MQFLDSGMVCAERMTGGRRMNLKKNIYNNDTLFLPGRKSQKDC